MSGPQTSQPFDPYYTWLGIPPSERPISYYRLLGLKPFESNETAIEAAVDQRLAYLRTKALGPHAAFAEKLISEITQARLVLLDPVRKQAYDAALSSTAHEGPGLSQQEAPARHSGTPRVAAPLGTGSYMPGNVRRFRRKSRLTKDQWIAALGLGLGLCFVIGVLVLWLSGKKIGSQGDRNPSPRQEQLAGGPPAPRVNDGSPADAGARLHGLPQPGRIPGANPPESLPRQAPPEPPRAPDAEAKPAVNPMANPAENNRWLEKVRRATVVIQGDRGQGSGFFVTTGAGKPVVVTNAHVIRDNFNLRLKLFDGREIPVQQGAVLADRDLAILAVEAINLPQPLELRGELPQVAEQVFAYGAPQGLTGTLTAGIVSAVRSSSGIRDVVDDGSFDKPVRKAEVRWIQTTAPISPGNSGGPLLDQQGRVVGINSLAFNNLLGQNLNFALSSTEVLPHLAAPQFAALPKSAPIGPGVFGVNQPQGGTPKSSPNSLYPFEQYSCQDITLPSGAVFQPGKVRPPEKWRLAIESGHVLVCRRGQITVSAKKEVGGGLFREDVSFGVGAVGEEGAAYIGGSRTRYHYTPGVVSPFAFYVFYDDNDVMRAAMAFEKGLLNGPAVLFDENGHPYVIANYYRGTRTGPLVVYDEEQWPAVYVEFTRNRKHGLVCVFDQHLPSWIENWRANQLVEACLIKWEGNQCQVLLASALTNPDDQALSQERMAKVSRYLDELDSLESELKRNVAEAFRWADNEIKKRRAAQFSAAATAAILARHRAREAAGAALRAEANARFQTGSGPPPLPIP